MAIHWNNFREVWFCTISQLSITIKPLPKGLASRRKFAKLHTQVTSSRNFMYIQMNWGRLVSTVTKRWLINLPQLAYEFERLNGSHCNSSQANASQRKWMANRKLDSSLKLNCVDLRRLTRALKVWPGSLTGDGPFQHNHARTHGHGTDADTDTCNACGRACTRIWSLTNSIDPRLKFWVGSQTRRQASS